MLDEFSSHSQYVAKEHDDRGIVNDFATAVFEEKNNRTIQKVLLPGNIIGHLCVSSRIGSIQLRTVVDPVRISTEQPACTEAASRRQLLVT